MKTSGTKITTPQTNKHPNFPADRQTQDIPRTKSHRTNDPNIPEGGASRESSQAGQPTGLDGYERGTGRA